MAEASMNRAKDLLPSQQGYRPAKIVAVLDDIAKGREVSRAVVALAWLLVKRQVVIVWLVPMVAAAGAEVVS